MRLVIHLRFFCKKKDDISGFLPYLSAGHACACVALISVECRSDIDGSAVVLASAGVVGAFDLQGGGRVTLKIVDSTFATSRLMIDAEI